MTLAEIFRNEGVEEGLKKGKAEGRAEGKAEGKLEGRAEGKAEGKLEGRAEGKAEGKLEGRAEGKEALANTAIRLTIKYVAPLSEDMKKQIHEQEISTLETMVNHIDECETIEDVRQYLK